MWNSPEGQTKMLYEIVCTKHTVMSTFTYCLLHCFHLSTNPLQRNYFLPPFRFQILKNRFNSHIANKWSFIDWVVLYPVSGVLFHVALFALIKSAERSSAILFSTFIIPFFSSFIESFDKFFISIGVKHSTQLDQRICDYPCRW